MRPRSFVFFLVTPALAVLACGGRVGTDSPRCPAPDQVNDSAPCAVEGLTCGSSQEGIDPCTDQATGPVQCSCSNGSWSCDVAYHCPNPNPTPVCPVASDVVDGVVCMPAGMTCMSAQGYTDCDGAYHAVSCMCQSKDTQTGVWTCPATPPSCLDAGPPPPSCPDPTSVKTGAACPQEGQQCPGNPQDCDGSTFYDAFQCENGQWMDIAPTICGADGGPYDGGSD